jgi:hypothetical protein
VVVLLINNYGFGDVVKENRRERKKERERRKKGSTGGVMVICF